MSGTPPKKKQTRARQRLARISHHFLSDSPDDESSTTRKNSNPTQRENIGINNSNSGIYVIVGMHSQKFPALLLATLLVRCGLNCEIFSPDLSTVATQQRIPVPLKISTRDINTPKKITVQLHIGEYYGANPDTRRYTLLLPTPATAQGLRESFIHLKQYYSQATTLNTGIIIIDTENIMQAQNYFTSLLKACQQFINTEAAETLCSYGFLRNSQQQECTPELSGIARLIFNDCIHSFDSTILKSDTHHTPNRHCSEELT